MEEPRREELDRDRLNIITQEMVEAITSPQHIEAIQAVRNAPEGRVNADRMPPVTNLWPK